MWREKLTSWWVDSPGLYLGSLWSLGEGSVATEAACPLGLCVPGVEMLGPVKWYTMGAQDTWRVSVQIQLAPQMLRSTYWMQGGQ